MNNFHHIITYGEDESIVIDDCMKKLADIPSDANFGFIYVNDSMSASLADILQQCKSTSLIRHWIGSLGVGLISTNIEIYDKPAISLLLCEFPEDEFNIVETISNTTELSNKLFWPQDSLSYFAMLHVDAYNPESQKLLDDLDHSIDNCFITGGITSSHGEQYHVANEVSSNGISGVIFSDKINVHSNLSQGCTPLGDKHSVTEHQDNIVITLDDKPALDVFYDDIGEILSRDIQSAASFVFAGICIPESDKSDYKVRNLVGVDEKKKIFAINDNLQPEDKILICKRDGESASKDMLQMLENLKKRITSPIRGGVYISCLGRGREQFGENSEEVKMIHDVLGEFPLTGFFANGEIHNKHIYGYTGVLTIFT